MIEVGKELEFVECRLKDIAFLAVRAEPIEPNDHKAVQHLMGEIAKEALKYLRIARAIEQREDGK